MSVINNNNISILKFMSVFKQPTNLLNKRPVMMSTYTGGAPSRSLHGEWKVLMFSVMASNYTMFAFTLAVFSL